MLVAPRHTTLQHICEGVLGKWLGAGVVMPSGHTIAPGEPFATAGDILLDRPVHPVRPEKLVSGSLNNDAMWSLLPAPETSPVWQLTGDLKGTRIIGGTFRLPEQAFLLLSECSGLRFEGVSFIGGTIAVLAPGSSAAFDRCHFHGCTLVAAEGAEAATADCTHEAAGVALFCSGRGTKAVAHGGALRHCEQCACVADAAMLELHGVACSGPCITAIEARGADSYLVMHGCTVKSSRHVPRHMQADAAQSTPARGGGAATGSPPPDETGSPASDCSPPHESRASRRHARPGNPPSPQRMPAPPRGGAAAGDCAGSRAGAGRQWSVCGVWVHSGARLDLARCTVRKMAWGLWLDGPTTRAEVEAYRASGMRRGSILANNGATIVHAPSAATSDEA